MNGIDCVRAVLASCRRGNLYTGSSVSAAARLHISTAGAARRQGCVLAAADGGLGAVLPLVSV